MELPENLKTIKTEHNIKERLNLHVKRRLQQEPPQALAITTPTPLPNDSEVNRRKGKPKETQKTRKPNKRTDKSNTGAAAVVAAASSLIEGEGGAGRKYKRHKKVVAAEVVACGSDESVAASVLGFSATAGGEDDGSRDGLQDVDAKSGAGGGSSGRDKDKCPDVLGMLLNVKKRALMEDPEVREFLAKVMNVIKS